MRRLQVLFGALFFFPFLGIAQQGMIEGRITDGLNGEALIGVNIVYEPGKGTVSDLEGDYSLQLPYGEYRLQVSYVGYVSQEKVVRLNQSRVSMDFQLKNVTLTEVEVVADLAQTRETPVAFSTITPVQLEEQLASQDIPILLNRTPGIYATQQGGGDGDSRINIRGFNQRNVAVMVDGIPVNDMENGWVYWSNWFGIDAVTRNIQVQRGLGASKLAIPSVGGTLNIITKGIDDKRKFSVKQEFGSDGFLRTSFGVNSGQLGKGWGITAAASYKQGNGWVDETWTKGWFYFLRIDKRLGRHLFSISAMGAPQKHGQRSFKKSIATFDKGYAADLGVDTTGLQPSRGIPFNENWGYLQRINENREPLSERMNFYHKPLLSLRHFLNLNERFYLSNIFYVSLGKGGGTGTAMSDKYGTPGSSTFPIDPVTGQLNLQSIYDVNAGSSDGRSRGILRASINDHYWFGWLSTINYKLKGPFELSGGIDLRTYRGAHYMEVHDLLGGQYFLDNVDKNSGTIARDEGDIIRYHDEGKVRWGGLFGLLKYQQGSLTAFINVSGSISGYNRVDYYMKKVLDLGDTTLNIGYSDTIVYNGSTYTRESPGLDYNRTPWKWFPGFTVKGGVNYNLSERSNVFVNLGLLSKAPRFNNVFYYENVEFTDAANEVVQAFEAGYSFYSRTISLDVNGYLTRWKNRPADRTTTYFDPVEEITYQVNINGMDALHMGLEAEFTHRPVDFLSWSLLLSFGDWRWKSEDTARIYINEKLAQSFYFNAKGVHVGDAAQVQVSADVRWEIIRRLYVTPVITYFTKNYSEFDPLSLSPDISGDDYLDENGNPKDSWKIPNYYLLDLHAGYTFAFNRKFSLDIRGSVLNVLDRMYISDAQNNDTYVGSEMGFDAASAGVFFGLGRRFNISARFSF